MKNAMNSHNLEMQTKPYIDESKTVFFNERLLQCLDATNKINAPKKVNMFNISFFLF